MKGLKGHLEAARRCVFIGDGRNDVPYSRQRQDEVTIQLAEVDVRLRDTEGRAHQIEKQLKGGAGPRRAPGIRRDPRGL